MPIQTTVRIRGVGTELRELRKVSRLTLRDVAEQLGWQASKVSRVETGKQGLTVEDMASLLVVYGVTGEDRRRLLGLAERSKEPGWWEVGGGLSKESRTMIQLESDATRIVNFQPLLVPGLLQTADYARAVMKACGPERVRRGGTACRPAGPAGDPQPRHAAGAAPDRGRVGAAPGRRRPSRDGPAAPAPSRGRRPADDHRPGAAVRGRRAHRPGRLIRRCSTSRSAKPLVHLEHKITAQSWRNRSRWRCSAGRASGWPRWRSDGRSRVGLLTGSQQSTTE